MAHTLNPLMEGNCPLIKHPTDQAHLSALRKVCAKCNLVVHALAFFCKYTPHLKVTTQDVSTAPQRGNLCVIAAYFNKELFTMSSLPFF